MTIKRRKDCKKIIENVGEGTQTMGIPFHLTLGSYPVESRDELVAQIEKIASRSKPFDVLLVNYDTFTDKVLFLEPTRPKELIDLRKSFECDYANGFESFILSKCNGFFR